MSMENLTDDELLSFLDGKGSDADREKIKNRVNSNPLLRKRAQELNTIHAYLQKQAVMAQPSKNFTERVMAGLHTQPPFTFLSPKNGLLLLFGLLIASGLAIVLASSGAPDQWRTFFNFSQLPLKNNWVKLPTGVPIDLKLVVKTVVLLNVVIGLVLLDRTILRPVFQKRTELFTWK